MCGEGKRRKGKCSDTLSCHLGRGECLSYGIRRSARDVG